MRTLLNLKKLYVSVWRIMSNPDNPYFFAIRDKASGKVLGTFSLMAITPKNRSVEMGTGDFGTCFTKDSSSHRSSIPAYEICL